MYTRETYNARSFPPSIDPVLRREFQSIQRALPGIACERTFNASVVTQAGFAADTWLTGSDLLVPPFGLQAGTLLTWTLSASKTPAGVAAPVFTVRTGRARSTADTGQLVITGSAQTAAADVAMITVACVVRSIGLVGVVQGTLQVIHNLAATGFASNAAGLVEATSAGFDMTSLANQYISLSINGGALAAWTVTQVRSDASW